MDREPEVRPRYLEQIPSLDSLRGIASLGVLLHHLILIRFGILGAPILQILQMPLFRILLTGRSLVLVFFVISGFVLFLSISQKQNFSFPRYILSRLARIYLPFLAASCLWVSCMVSLKYFELIPVLSPPGTPVMASNWAQPLNVIDILHHALLVGDERGGKVNSVVWSLVYELRISFLMPFVYLFLFRLGSPIFVAMIVVSELVVILIFGNSNHSYRAYEADDVWVAFLLTLHFLNLFCIGAILAHNRNLVTSFLRRRGLPVRLSIVGASILCLSVHNDLISWVGAAALVCVAICPGKIRNFLEGEIFLAAGKISYSLYLVHVPVMVMLFYLTPNFWPVWALPIIYISASTLTGFAFYLFVEKPCINLSRSINSGGWKRSDKVRTYS